MTDTAIETRRAGRSLMHGLVRQAPFVALLLLIAFGAWRYDNFLSSFNISTTLRYNSMFALTALGIDLLKAIALALGHPEDAFAAVYESDPGVKAGGGSHAAPLIGKAFRKFFSGDKASPEETPAAEEPADESN